MNKDDVKMKMAIISYLSPCCHLTHMGRPVFLSALLKNELLVGRPRWTHLWALASSTDSTLVDTTSLQRTRPCTLHM
ncbi:hypothetical protein H8959_011529 [Pygathrix nigripes]